jgi:hypothetical protein
VGRDLLAVACDDGKGANDDRAMWLLGLSPPVSPAQLFTGVGPIRKKELSHIGLLAWHNYFCQCDAKLMRIDDLNLVMVNLIHGPSIL